MTGQKRFKVTIQASFRDALGKVAKKRYKGRDSHKEAFLARVLSFLEALQQGPHNVKGCALEPWPAKSVLDGFTLWKLHFRMPYLSGAAGEGRIITLVDDANAVAFPVTVYTHADYLKRPDDAALRRLIDRAQDPGES